METENVWQGITFDLFHMTMAEVEGKIVISQRPTGTELTSPIAFLIRNEGPDAMEIRFDWYKIPSRRKKKIYSLKPKQQKRFVVPSQRRVAIFWRDVQ